VLVIAVGCAISPLWFGFYDLSVWGPIALVMLAALLAVLVGGGQLPSWPSQLVLAGLVGLAAGSWLSRSWADASDQALIAADRWILYAATFGVLAATVRGRRAALWFPGAIATGAMAVAGYILVRLGFGDAREMFIGTRLNQPLGYVNGQASYLLLGVWPLVAFAERARVAVSAAMVSGGTALVCLTVMSQSRGIALAGAAGVLAIVTLVPGRVRRAWILVVMAAWVAVAIDPLLEVSRHPVAGLPRVDALHGAARATALSALGAGITWAILQLLAATAAGGGVRARRALTVVPRAGLGLLGLLAVAATVAAAPRITDTTRSQYDAFVHLRSPGTGARFFSGGGHRYDYWRIAWGEFRERPGSGVGAGNYTRDYYLRRRTAENIRQPHSLPLQVLAELGLAGAAALALVLAGLTAGLWRTVGAARLDRDARTLAVGAGGMVVCWFVQTSVDWIHLLPGLTGAALGAGAMLTAVPRPHAATRVGRPLRLAATGLGAALLAGSALAVARPLLVEHDLSRGRKQLRSNPGVASAHARSARSLEPDSLAAHYLEAAAEARVDNYDGARAVLLEATRSQPRAFVPWALLGDLSTRRGDLAGARAYYLRAARLNPREPSLRALARRPPAPTSPPTSGTTR